MHALLLLRRDRAARRVAVWLVVRRQRDRGAASASSLGAAALAVVRPRPTTVPDEFTTITPYVATLLVLALASQRLRPPAADGLPYRRGQGG